MTPVFYFIKAARFITKIQSAGDNYWKLTEEGVAFGYPRSISSGWPGLPGSIDAAFTYNKNGRTYFFKVNVVFFLIILMHIEQKYFVLNFLD
jgi:Hemopexin